MKRRPKVSASRALQTIMRAQNNICGGCGHHLPRHGEPAEYRHWPTLDHVWPQSRGGKVVIAMHRCCNFAKADRQPTGCEILFASLVTAVTGAPA